MYLKSISLVNFKNYHETHVSFERGVNCLLGNNGAGKTNILDAVHYLSMCKSFLNASDKQNIRFDQPFFSIKGVFHKNEKDYTIHCAVKHGEKKIVHHNKKTYDKLSEHIGLFPCVIVSPYDKDLIAEGSEVRRKWMDSIIAQSDREYLFDLQRYARVLTQRNALLKSMYQDNHIDVERLEIWDAQLIALGVRIHQCRTVFLHSFVPILHDFYARIADSSEQIDIRYQSQLNEQQFETLLPQFHHKDMIAQHTSIGTHKDDLVFLLSDRSIKKFGSQGQQKSFVIALRLAQYNWLKTKLSINPILLLDDIFDKLDQHRVQQLLEMVASDTFGQVLITHTDLQRMRHILMTNNIEASLYQIMDNQAAPTQLPVL